MIKFILLMAFLFFNENVYAIVVESIYEYKAWKCFIYNLKRKRWEEVDSFSLSRLKTFLTIVFVFRYARDDSRSTFVLSLSFSQVRTSPRFEL